METIQTIIQTIIEWLKEQITLISIIGVCATIYFGLKGLKMGKLAHINLALCGNENKNVDKAKEFVNLIIYDLNNPECNAKVKWIEDGMPIIKNNSNKSINNIVVQLSYDYHRKEIHFNLDHFNPDFEKSDWDTTDTAYTTIFKYKHNYLAAHDEIHNPIKYFWLPASKPFSESGYKIEVEYSIKYDGLKKNRDFKVENVLFLNECLDDEEKNSLIENKIDSFLTDCYKKGCFTVFKKKTIVSVVNHNNVQVVNPPKRLTDEKFEKFKKEFIENTII